MRESMKKVSRFWGKTFILPRFQLKYVTLTLLLCEVMVLAVWYVGKLTIIHFIQNGMIFDSYVITLLETLSGYILIASLCVNVVILVLAALISNKVAGPIYRLKKGLKELRKGNLDINIRLRKHDEFQETAHEFNATVHALKHQIHSNHKLLTGVQHRLQKMESHNGHVRTGQKSKEITSVLNYIKRSKAKIKF